MTLWTRLGFLIPILWMLGFVVVSFADKMLPGAIPDQMIFTIGHLLGTMFVWFFSLSFGVTKVSEVVNVETGEKTVLERPHKFLMFSPIVWGLMLTAALAWFLYRPPPRAWLELATQRQQEIQKTITEASNQVKEKVTGNYDVRDWTNAEGKKLRARFLKVETINNVKTVFVIREKDNTEKSFSFEQLSTEDQHYVNQRASKP